MEFLTLIGSLLVAVLLTGCLSSSEKAEALAHGPTLRAQQTRYTEHVGDVEGCKALGPVKAVSLVALQEHAAQLGADVVYHKHVTMAWKYFTGEAYDCGGRYTPTVKTVPASE
jgi:hypothetical protein